MPRKIWTAAELEHMTRAEQQAIFEESIIWDLDDAPQNLVARLREDVEQHIAGPNAARTALRRPTIS